MTSTPSAYDDCYTLFKRYCGRNILRIEREMHALGHSNFNRRILYARTENGVRKPGWIKKFDWNSPEPDRGPRADAAVEVPPRSVSDRQCSRQPFPAPPSAGADHSSDFHAWLKRVSANMNWDWRHQTHIIEQLEKVTSGECRRLMIFLPPRHGKSELVTVRYSAWRMRRNPSMNIILGSYNQQLANRFSRKVRRVLTESHAAEKAAAALRVKEGGTGAAEAAGNKCRCCRCGSENTARQERGPASPAADSPFPFTSSRPANSIAEWETAAGGGFRAVGVGGGVTGFGASLIVIDDPVKSRAEAESDTYRENVWNWFNDDLYTRLEPDGAVILIQTRWHEDDLAGRLLNEMKNGGEQWTVIDLPAIAETAQIRNADRGLRNEELSMSSATSLIKMHDVQTSEAHLQTPAPGNLQTGIRDPQSPDWRQPGEALCPERFDIPALEKIRRKLGTDSFSALYQQNPTPSEGGTFKKAWFRKIIPAAPAGLKWKRGYDLAVSTRTNADYTASFRCAFDADGNLIIDGGFRGRIEFPEQRRFIVERIRSEPDTEHGIELALHGQALIQDLRREPGVRGHLLRGVKVGLDKLTRSLAWAPLAEEGKVILVRGPWIEEFIEEAAAFPFGRHDDQIDAVSLAVQMLKKPFYRSFGF